MANSFTGTMNDAAARRELILQAADRLLRHYGAGKTTVADVAREAGVGVGSVYLEFPSKDAIVEALSRTRHRAVLDAMHAAASTAGRPFPERLTAVFEARLRAYLAIADEGAHACDLVHCVSAAVKSAQASFHDEELALVVDLLRRGAEAGEVEPGEPEATARALLRAYASFKPPWVSGRDRGEVARDLAAMDQLVLHGVVRRAPRPARARKG
jgi:AcrR family transcriptional regulator